MKPVILEPNLEHVNILGQEYRIIIDESLKDTNADGMCKEYDKEIYIRNFKDMLCNDDTELTKKRRWDEVLRHEIIHAFFIESGLEEYSSNEQLVDWIAKQFPKMQDAFENTGCL